MFSQIRLGNRLIFEIHRLHELVLFSFSFNYIDIKGKLDRFCRNEDNMTEGEISKILYYNPIKGIFTYLYALTKENAVISLGMKT